ncbi:MAG: hypothetical protein LBV54_03255, partial [Puniceicoccales bacterium]|jgi:tetratricopeptide (TPR) repeat protein|nr:hypothetical protein [Puniceicoccales bacterium]
LSDADGIAKFDKTTPAAFVVYARIFEANGREKEAINAYKEAVKRNPYDTAVLSDFMLFHEKRNDNANLLTIINYHIDAAPYDPRWYALRAKWLFDMKDYESSRKNVEMVRTLRKVKLPDRGVFESVNGLIARLKGAGVKIDYLEENK